VWQCCHRGDCCKTGAVTMTESEAALLRERKPEAVFLPYQGKVVLMGTPCPFYQDGCTVYDIRPYNCRRYMCGREGDEPFDPAPIPAKVLQIRGLRKQYQMNQKKAQKWARQHGW
jgi:Fe-S-cluster containining protein